MANLTKNWNLPQKEGNEVRGPLGVVKTFVGAMLAIVKGTGYLVTPDNTVYPPQRLQGVSEDNLDNSGGLVGDKNALFLRKGIFKFNGGGSLTVADIDKWVYLSDDNTITTTVNAFPVGILANVDAEGAWVDIEPAVKRYCFRLRIEKSPAILTVSGATVKELAYVCPVGALAYVQAAKYVQMIKPNYATSAALDFKRYTGGVGTSILTGTKDVQNNADAVDTALATGITLNTTGHASRKMVAGDHLTAEVATVGAQTTQGKVIGILEILEWGGDNT